VGMKGKKRELDQHVPVLPWRAGVVVSFLHVPHEVIRAHLLRHLSWRALDRLAQVCRYLREDARFEQGKRARRRYPREETDAQARRVYLFMERNVRNGGDRISFPRIC
jgi:hypothetical protein